MSNWFESLNAPFGAWCFLTLPVFPSPTKAGLCLNAPFGAWCFLTSTESAREGHGPLVGLNAPFGAWCFLTQDG